MDLGDVKRIAIGYLGNVHHVSHESKALQLELRDVSLQQHVDLRGGTFYTSESLFL